MHTVDAQQRARIARAIWAYTTMDQKALAEQSGIKYSRLRAIMARENPDEATLDELLALAEIAGVPEAFALNGFAAVTDDRPGLAARVAALEELVRSAYVDRDLLHAEVEALNETIEARYAELAEQALPPDTRRSRAEDRPA
jgi:transcriptional regulator with XRE-family HTH domain